MTGKIIRIVVATLVVLLLLGSLYFLINRNRQAPVRIETIAPQIGTIISKAVATGSIVPRLEVAIKPRVSGVVDELFVQPGELIERGQLIARIQLLPDAVTLNSAQARVDTARISSNNAKSELARFRKLFNQKLISRGEYDKYRYEFDIRAEELEGAEKNLRVLREGGAEDGGAISNEIRATVAGTVLDVSVKQGESVTETNNFNEGTTIAAIADMTDMVFIGTVDESEVGRIREGMALQISIGAIEDVLFEGVLEFISPKGESNEGSVQFEIRAAMTDTQSSTVRAGYSATADVVLDRRDEVLTLDERVLQFEGDKVFVNVEVAEQQFERRSIEVGLSDGIRIEVLDGLSESSRVRAR